MKEGVTSRYRTFEPDVITERTYYCYSRVGLCRPAFSCGVFEEV